MRYAIIEDGVVKNVVLADADFAAQQGWVECPEAGPGWKYENGVFVAAPPSEPPAPPPAPTKEELLAQLQALTAQINALE